MVEACAEVSHYEIFESFSGGVQGVKSEATANSEQHLFVCPEAVSPPS